MPAAYRFLKEHEYAAGQSADGTIDQASNTLAAVTPADATEKLQLFWFLIEPTGVTTTTVTLLDTEDNEIVSKIVSQNESFVFGIPIELITPGAGIKVTLSATNEHRWCASFNAVKV